MHRKRCGRLRYQIRAGINEIKRRKNASIFIKTIFGGKMPENAEKTRVQRVQGQCNIILCIRCIRKGGKMERLTFEYMGLNALRELGTFDKYNKEKCIDCESCGVCCEEFVFSNCANCPIQKAFDKLADYEDAEEKGLLIRLPFKIGQKVYFIYESLIDGSLMIGRMEYLYSCLDFPRTFYATREEAEAALQKMQEDGE